MFALMIVAGVLMLLATGVLLDRSHRTSRAARWNDMVFPPGACLGDAQVRALFRVLG